MSSPSLLLACKAGMRAFCTVVAILVVLGVQAQDVVNLADPSLCSDSSKHANPLINVTNRHLTLYLEGGEEQHLPKDCTLRVKGADRLMVYVESMYLRGGGQLGCVDFIQFGKDDPIPFMTVKKSNKLCGLVSDWPYDVEGNDLIVWLHWDKNRPENYRETFAVVKLRMTITPYKMKNFGKRYDKCATKGHYIRREFFCDGVVNCAVDGAQRARDESREQCVTTTPRPTQPPTTVVYPTTASDYSNIGFESEDLRLGTIISVSLGVLVGLACCMVCCVRRCSRVAEPSTPTSEEVCQQIRLSGLPILSARGENRRSEEVVPASQILRTPEQAVPLAEDPPPPAYNEIFPEDYVFNKEPTHSGNAV